MNIDFSADSELGKELTQWWRRLQEDTGTRAELRRCNTPAEVAMTASFNRFCHRLRPLLKGQWNWEERLASVLGLLSHIKTDAHGRGLAEQMSDGNPPVVSELRFRRLLQRDTGDIYPAMVRILRMLKGSADIHDLARSVFFWGGKVKKRWAYAYFPRVPEKKSA